MVFSPAPADDITQRKTNPLFVRATMSGYQVTHRSASTRPEARLQADRDDLDDFAYGHEHMASFQRTFEENGGNIEQKLCRRS